MNTKSKRKVKYKLPKNKNTAALIRNRYFKHLSDSNPMYSLILGAAGAIWAMRQVLKLLRD